MPIKLMTTTEYGWMLDATFSISLTSSYSSTIARRAPTICLVMVAISTFAIWYPNADDLRIRMKDMDQFTLQSSLLQLTGHGAWSLYSVFSPWYIHLYLSRILSPRGLPPIIYNSALHLRYSAPRFVHWAIITTMLLWIVPSLLEVSYSTLTNRRHSFPAVATSPCTWLLL